jgi:hypothetical protein
MENTGDSENSTTCRQHQGSLVITGSKRWLKYAESCQIIFPALLGTSISDHLLRYDIVTWCSSRRLSPYQRDGG